jgi:hypothetical protein
VLSELPPLAALLAALKAEGAAAEGTSMFREAMLRNVKVRMLWYAEGWWTNPDWELFNDYAKYMALGARAAEVDELIEEMVKVGLPEVAGVEKSNWRQYTQYLQGQPAFDHSSIDAIVRDTVLGSYSYMGPVVITRLQAPSPSRIITATRS